MANIEFVFEDTGCSVVWLNYATEFNQTVAFADGAKGRRMG